MVELAQEAKTIKPENYDTEMRQCAKLASAISQCDGGAAVGWDLNHLTVYRLAEIVMERIVREFNEGASVLSKL